MEERRGYVASYTHVCTACGARLEVHERYRGKTLRCTSCGTEFVAKPPHDPAPRTEQVEREVPQTPRPPAPPETRARRRRWILISVVAAVVLGSLLLWLGGDRSHGFASGLFASDKVRTELGILDRDDGGAVIAALDRETVRELISALEAGDQSSLAEISSRPQCIEVAPGTRVRVLERRKRAVEARIRILEGPWASRIVWVPIGWVK